MPIQRPLKDINLYFNFSIPEITSMLINMYSPTFKICFLVAAAASVFMCAGTSNTKICVETDKQALLNLKVGFVDTLGVLSSWKHEADCCEWSGISCNPSTGHVTRLQVSGLEGKIDSSICDLQHLTHLNLRYNSFGGSQIPKCIGSHNHHLIELNLSHNSLGGTIPHELRNLSNLQTLDLGNNYSDDELIVKDLEWISNLSSLRHLDLSGVNLSIAIDWQLSLSKIAPQLRKLVLLDSYLVGIFPHELANLSNLETLDLSGNSDLIVNDLGWVSHLPSLRHLDLSGVNLSRALDWRSSLSKSSSLLELNLDECSLPLVNPKSYVHSNYSTALTSLSLRYNDLDTSILPWVSNVSKSVVEIDLSHNYFQHIPTGTFSNMNSLRSLDISSSSLQHIASDAFTNTTSLEILRLLDNNLDIDIGKAISNLCRLRDLDLSSNNLTDPLSNLVAQFYCAHHSIETLGVTHNPYRSGPFPDFSNFSSLVTLDLTNTSLNGQIPQSFGHLPHLLELDIRSNNLSGPFPELHELSSLEELHMSDNKLNGVVNEEHLSTLSNLRILDVSYNLLSFNFSPKWVPPFQLETFFARSCNFTSIGFPMWLKHHRELSELDISSGSISSSVPEWIWLFPNWFYFNISHNKINGELPRSLPKSGAIWDFSFNNLSGPIPQLSPQTEALVLSNNNFAGSISSLCATLHSPLAYLDMSNNLLSGKLPHCWRQFPYLRALILANNNFSGTIPSSISSLKNIATIHLNKNNFSGNIPSFLNSLWLQFIDCGENNLNGKLPTWIGDYLPRLIVLRLQKNKFYGDIPTSLCKSSNIQILDLSQNYFTGTIPHCLSNISAFSNLMISRFIISYSFYGILDSDRSYIENAMLNWKGADVKYDKNLGLMTSIDLSSNQLKGQIPSDIASLEALASLNLSRNKLTGFIPNNMGQMKMLESLDLSSNSLSGRIPSSFSSLNFLSFMNVSFNNLSGEIPQTTQLQTFDASFYIGNNGLCGPPLTKGCSKSDNFDQNHKKNPNIDFNEGDEYITYGFYISMIFGFLVGFWGVCGSLIFKSSWRAAYFQFFINMYDWIYVHWAIFKAKMKRRLYV